MRREGEMGDEAAHGSVSSRGHPLTAESDMAGGRLSPALDPRLLSSPPSEFTLLVVWL